jgi:hypothetical protein
MGQLIRGFESPLLRQDLDDPCFGTAIVEVFSIPANGAKSG